jgi:hypothetical protein
MISILFIVGAILGVIGGILMFRFIRHMEEEGKKIGYDFFSRDYALSWFRPDRLPVTMRPFARQARLAGMLFLWPAFAFICVAFFLK